MWNKLVMAFVAVTVGAFADAHLVVHPNSLPSSYENQANLTEQDLDRHQFVDQALESYAPVYIRRTSFSGNLASVSFRGLTAAQSLILLDGVPLNNAADGMFDLSILPGQSLDAIKVNPGASSVLHGGHATGGVVDMTSHRAHKDETKLNLEGGSFNTLKGYSHLDQVYDRGNYSLYVQGYRTDGLPKYEKARILGERNKTNNGGAGAYLNHSFRKADVSLFTRMNEGYLKYDADVVNVPPKPQGDKYRRMNLVGTKIANDMPSQQIHHELLLARYSDYINYKVPYVSEHKKYYSKYHVTYFGIKDGETHVVVSGDHDKLIQSDDFKKHITMYGTALTHNHMIFQNFYVDLGVRNDHHSRFKNHQTYSSGVRYRYQDTTFFVSYRTGFRPPTVSALYQEGPYSEPNHNLKPEKVNAAEMGVKYNFSKSSEIQVAYHNTVLKKMLYTRQLDNWKYKSFNAHKATRIDGVDVQGQWVPKEGLKLSLSYTLNDFNRTQPGLEVSSPRHKINAAMEWDIQEDLKTQIAARWVGNRRGTGETLRNYTVVDANLGYHPTKTCEVYLKINNLMDERYTMVSAYRAPRREIYVGTTLTF